MVFIKNSLPKHQKCIQYCSFVSFRSLSGYLNNDSHAYLNISSLHLNAAKFTKKNLQNCLWQRSITSQSCSNPHRRPNQRRRKGPPLQEKIIHSNNNNNRPSNGHVRPPVQVGWRQICALFRRENFGVGGRRSRGLPIHSNKREMKKLWPSSGVCCWSSRP